MLLLDFDQSPHLNTFFIHVRCLSTMFLIKVIAGKMDWNVQIVLESLSRIHTHTLVETYVVFVRVSWQGNKLFPLLQGFCCHRGQRSKFTDQKVTQMRHLVDKKLNRKVHL